MGGNASLRLCERLRSVAADDGDGAHAVQAAEHARLALQLLGTCTACREHKQPVEDLQRFIQCTSKQGMYQPPLEQVSL